MRLRSGLLQNSFVAQSRVMKKLLAFLLILLVALNVALLLQKKEGKTQDDKALALTMPKLDLKDFKPGILPGLVSF